MLCVLKGAFAFFFQHQRVCTLKSTALREDPTYTMIYITGLYFFVMYVIPFFLLAVLNCRTGFEIHRARLRRHSVLTSGSLSGGNETMLMNGSKKRYVIIIETFEKPFFVSNECEKLHFA